MFKKEERKISTPIIAGVSLLLVSAALFIAGKSLFSDAKSPGIADGKSQSSFFEKQGENKFLASSAYQSAQRSDSISVLVKANEGYASSSAVLPKKETQLSFSSSLKDSYPEGALSDFEKQAQQELGEADKTDQPPAAGAAPKAGYGDNQPGETKQAEVSGSRQASPSRQPGSAISSKKSAFTSKLPAMDNFNAIRPSKNFASGGSGGAFESSSSQTGGFGDSSSNYAGASGMGGSSSSGNSSSSGESSLGGSSSSGGLNSNSSNNSKPDVPRPQMLAHKQVYEFGTVNLYEYARKLVTVMNVGKKNLTIRKINRLNDEDYSFSLDNNKCSGKTLAPKAECTFEIVFRPTSGGEKGDGFEIESNDADKIPYSNYIETTGRGGSYWYSYYWLSRYKATTKMDFGTVTAGHALELNYLLRNNSGHTWRDINFYRNANASFSVSYHNCPSTMVNGSYCLVRIKFAPQDAFLKSLSANYGKYKAVNGFNGKKEILEKPVFPPYVIESPFELELGGYIIAKARVSSSTVHTTVRYIPLRAFASARYPDPKIRRVDKYYSF